MIRHLLTPGYSTHRYQIIQDELGDPDKQYVPHLQLSGRINVLRAEDKHRAGADMEKVLAKFYCEGGVDIQHDDLVNDLDGNTWKVLSAPERRRLAGGGYTEAVVELVP